MGIDSILGEQIKLFRSIFSGRGDAYGLETSRGPIAVREELNDALIQAHLQGSKRIGCYPLRPDNTCLWACIDVDELDKKKVERIIVSFIENNLYPYVECSKSKGFHVWIFFDGSIPASKIRKSLLHILRTASVDGIEIFPKQSGVNSNNGLGNYVFLPLHGSSIRHGKTVFLNSQFQPYENQWGHLSTIHRTKTSNVLSLAAEIPNEPKVEVDSDSEGSLDVGKFLINYKIGFRIKKDPDRTLYLLERCLFADQHTTKDIPGDSSILQGVDGKLAYQCFHHHCQDRTWADARRVISGDASLREFMEGYSPGEVRTKNLTETLRCWVSNSFGKINIADCYRDLGVISPKDKGLIRVNFHRMCDKGILERGTVNGTFIKIESQADEIEIKNTVPIPLALTLPGNLQQHVALFPKNLIVCAGSSNGGKTAYALNTAYSNRNQFDVWYFTTEMDSDELTLRVNNFEYPKNEWDKITFKPWESHHSIRPGAFNIIDYLEVREGEFWRVGEDLRLIFGRLVKGLALVFIQMDRGKEFGWGGQKTVDKARLYFTLDNNKLTIVKGKNWASGENPNGKVRPFKLHKGAAFEWDSWVDHNDQR